MKPTLLEIAESYPDMTINVKLSELLEAFRTIADDICATHVIEVPEEKEDVLLTREEVSKQLGVSETTLWRWDKEGYLKSTKLGVAVRYHQSDIDALKQKRGGW